MVFMSNDAFSIVTDALILREERPASDRDDNNLMKGEVCQCAAPATPGRIELDDRRDRRVDMAGRVKE